jgi:hypothetical protein
MGWRDNRKSPKMRRRAAHDRNKERIKRRRERNRQERLALKNPAPAE